MKCKTRPVLAALCSIALFTCGAIHAQDAAPGGSLDVTKLVQQTVSGNSLTIDVNNDLGSDPAPTLKKKLKVDYTVNGVAASTVVLEGSTLEIHPAKGAKLVVTKAVYGDLPDAQKVDVAKVLTNAIQGDKLTLDVNNEVLGGDPAPTTVKKLEVKYTVGGKAGTATVNEFETLTLPSSTDGTGKLVIVSATYGAL